MNCPTDSGSENVQVTPSFVSEPTLGSWASVGVGGGLLFV